MGLSFSGVLMKVMFQPFRVGKTAVRFVLGADQSNLEQFVLIRGSQALGG